MDGRIPLGELERRTVGALRVCRPPQRSLFWSIVVTNTKQTLGISLPSFLSIVSTTPSVTITNIPTKHNQG